MHLDIVDIEEQEQNGYEVDNSPVLLWLQEQGQEVGLGETVDQSQREQDLVQGAHFPRQLQRGKLFDVERTEH